MILSKASAREIVASSTWMPSWASVAAMSETAVWTVDCSRSRSAGISSGFWVFGGSPSAARVSLIAAHASLTRWRATSSVLFLWSSSACVAEPWRTRLAIRRWSTSANAWLDSFARSVATCAFSEATWRLNCSCAFLRRNQLPRAEASCAWACVRAMASCARASWTAASDWATATSNGSRSSRTSSVPASTRSFCSTRTSVTRPSTRGLTYVMWPATNASSVDSVVRAVWIAGRP